MLNEQLPNLEMEPRPAGPRAMRGRTEWTLRSAAHVPAEDTAREPKALPQTRDLDLDKAAGEPGSLEGAHPASVSHSLGLCAGMEPRLSAPPRTAAEGRRSGLRTAVTLDIAFQCQPPVEARGCQGAREACAPGLCLGVRLPRLPSGPVTRFLIHHLRTSRLHIPGRWRVPRRRGRLPWL